MALSNVLIVNVLYKYPECKTRGEKYGLTGKLFFRRSLCHRVVLSISTLILDL